jgi:hypothetical protein
MIQARKATYRKMAQALKADYISQGAFKTGKITGTMQGRTFTVEPFTTGGGGGSSTFWTRISMDCANKGIPLTVRADFFKCINTKLVKPFKPQNPLQHAFDRVIIRHGTEWSAGESICELVLAQQWWSGTVTGFTVRNRA